ncbi:MAG: 2-C-methyl-D-erythritol 4-phosphate cytidylyltransferase [Candidatus Cryptobacteroides sp.]
MERQKYLIAVAAGKGVRMGGDLPKQFVELDGRAILHRTIERFAGACPDLKVVTVLNPDWIPYWRRYCYSHAMVVRQHLVNGGITRFHSVRNALDAIPDGAVVAVHDGVRPFVSEAQILRLFELAGEHSAVVPVLPCTDTLKKLRMEDGNLVPLRETLDRSLLYGAQTPQIFHSEVLREAYRQPFDQTFTDDASVVERCGGDIFYTDGERLNFKITTPEDMVMASALLAAGTVQDGSQSLARAEKLVF